MTIATQLQMVCPLWQDRNLDLAAPCGRPLRGRDLLLATYGLPP